MCKTNQKNNESDCNGQGKPIHFGESITYLTHHDRMAKDLGEDLGVARTFLHTHSKMIDGNIRWVDEHAQDFHDKFTAKWNAILSAYNSSQVKGETSLQPLSEMDIWIKEVGGPKKERVYGLLGKSN
ncbi:hypothetical protein ACH5RR_039036 [Cinchona calisaya]|uniref:Uncharacterized protein n=1 Tax=Cinchona calisaya TaxID=153742 RepID=A0ABD2XYE7_9GENT